MIKKCKFGLILDINIIWPTALLRVSIDIDKHIEGHDRIFQQNVIRRPHEIKGELKILVLPLSGLKGMVCFCF